MKKENGEIVQRLKPVKEEANITFVTNFIQALLANIVHHRNQLQHFRKVHPSFLEIFNAAFIDIDFSENLKIPDSTRTFLSKGRNVFFFQRKSGMRKAFREQRVTQQKEKNVNFNHC